MSWAPRRRGSFQKVRAALAKPSACDPNFHWCVSANQDTTKLSIDVRATPQNTSSDRSQRAFLPLPHQALKGRGLWANDGKAGAFRSHRRDGRRDYDQYSTYISPVARENHRSPARSVPRGCGKTPLRAGLGKGTTGVPGKPGFGLLGWTSSTRAVNAAPSVAASRWGNAALRKAFFRSLLGSLRVRLAGLLPQEAK